MFSQSIIECFYSTFEESKRRPGKIEHYSCTLLSSMDEWLQQRPASWCTYWSSEGDRSQPWYQQTWITDEEDNQFPFLSINIIESKQLDDLNLTGVEIKIKIERKVNIDHFSLIANVLQHSGLLKVEKYFYILKNSKNFNPRLRVEEISHRHGGIKECGLEQSEKPGLFWKDRRAPAAWLRLKIFLLIVALNPQYGARLGVVVDWRTLLTLNHRLYWDRMNLLHH